MFKYRNAIRQNQKTLSFVVEVKKSQDYFKKETQRIHIKGDFPPNYVVGGEADLSTNPCSSHKSLCKHFLTFADTESQVKFVDMTCSNCIHIYNFLKSCGSFHSLIFRYLIIIL
jgi:hypothetical protein